MNTALWSIQSICAVIFVFTGLLKTTVQKDKLKEMGVAGLENFSPRSVFLIGISEVLGAMGLILPLLLGIFPRLTSISAVGLALIMILASRVHYQRMEYQNVAVNLTIMIFCAVIAYFRW
jgi:hypothetical protein